ncbi:MAG: protein phosphatase 2C domain-containing protein [Deltaproteobacteria bacterium]|nr:protein phosphatase 2C domain-containing protein [Deltaproteobacteria bacterium]
MKLVAWAKTDVGRKRDHNEDSYLADDGLGLYAVADGMGGHQGGETASRLALEVLAARVRQAKDDMLAAAKAIEDQRRSELFRSTEPVAAIDDTLPLGPPPVTRTDEPTDPLMDIATPPAMTVLRAAARAAGQTIYDTALADPNLRGMGTTLTAMMYDAGRMHVVHAGDSRCYLFRDGTLRQLTDDHSWIAEQVRSGAMTEAEAKESKFRHVITRSVGFERDVEVDARGVVVEPGDCFLLCTDGMSNHVEHADLERVLAATWFRRAPQSLVDIANQRGGDDNITVVAVMIANDEE